MKNKLDCILLIDDDEPTNYISKMLIEEVGCATHIEIAQSGQKALDFLTRNDACNSETKALPRPELIFLDINMPAMNGWEFLEKYDALPPHHKSEVIMVMLTTSLNPDDVMMANANPDISGFETKPLTAQKLEGILKKYFHPVE